MDNIGQWELGRPFNSVGRITIRAAVFLQSGVPSLHPACVLTNTTNTTTLSVSPGVTYPGDRSEYLGRLLAIHHAEL